MIRQQVLYLINTCVTCFTSQFSSPAPCVGHSSRFIIPLWGLIMFIKYCHTISSTNKQGVSEWSVKKFLKQLALSFVVKLNIHLFGYEILQKSQLLKTIGNEKHMPRGLYYVHYKLSNKVSYSLVP